MFVHLQSLVLAVIGPGWLKENIRMYAIEMDANDWFHADSYSLAEGDYHLWCILIGDG